MDPTLEAKIQRAIEPIRSSLNLDGGDIVFECLKGDVAYFSLTIEDANCADCIMPREVLSEIVHSRIRSDDIYIVDVDIDDPRESV